MEPELTEQQKKNQESYKEYTFSVLPADESVADSVRIEMKHIALDLDFAVTLGADWPWKKPVAVSEPIDVQEIDGAAVNKLFGNEDSDDEEEDDQDPEPKVVLTPPPPPTTMECILERKQSKDMEVFLRGSDKTAHVELQFELNGVMQTVKVPQTAQSIERLVVKE